VPVALWHGDIDTNSPLATARPLFSRRQGIDEIVARYDYDNENEIIHEGSGMPVDLSVSSIVSQ